MQKDARQSKTGAVRNAVDDERHFRSVRMTVKQRKKTDHSDSKHHGQPNGACDQHAKDQDRGQNSLLNKGKLTSRHSQHAAKDHDSDKRTRHDPSHPPTHLSSPQTDGKHRKHVIHSQDRMEESGREPARLPYSYVR